MISLPNHYGPLLRFLHCAMDQSVTTALEAMELTSAQGHILGYCKMQKRPPCPRDIEEAFHLSHPTVSGLLSRMEKKGFIQMVTDEYDRRCKRIHILPKGDECAHVIYETIVQAEKQMVQGFTPPEQAQFRRLLERAISNMGAWPCQQKQGGR